jgi:hypothetical protein
MSQTLPAIVLAHPLGSAMAGTKVFLIDGTSQVLNSSGQLPTGVSNGVASSLLANGWSVVSAS